MAQNSVTISTASSCLDSNHNRDEMDFSLEATLVAVHESQHLFFENKFNLSKETVVAHRDVSLYHSMGCLYHSLCYAIFTMEKDQIDIALEQSQQTMKMVESRRRRTSFASKLTGFFSKPDYNDYTDEEAHAEVCYGELSFMTMMLTFLSDQSFLSMIRGARKFMACNAAYKLCNEIMKSKSNWGSDAIKMHFDCGVLCGWGFINLIFSHLPNRVLKVMTLVGFSADRELGLRHLHTATDDMRGLFRSKLAGFLVCLYSFYVEQLFGLGEADLPWVRTIVNDGLKRYPGGAFDLFWAGRLYQLNGETELAIEHFEKSIASQNEFKQMHNVCMWDMLWSYASLCNWQKAADCAMTLQGQCKWSASTNAYQYACFMYMTMEEENRPELREEVDKAMARVPELRTRYAGKTLPPEKFALIMAERYNNGDKELVLPALVLFYIWNIYGNSAERTDLLEPLLDRINMKIKLVSGDTYYVLLLLKGVCLRNMKRATEAIECFTTILESEKDIVKDNYVPPHAAFELGLTLIDVKDYEQARLWLEKARDTYSGFLVESLVHLRIHGALNKLKLLKKI